MIIKVNSIDDCKICDNFLTLLIQDERKYDTTIDAKFVVKDYFINMINNHNILLLAFLLLVVDKKLQFQAYFLRLFCCQNTRVPE